MNINYIKCHGTGNMFYIIDEFEETLVKEVDKRKFVMGICKIDSELDGILFLVKSLDGLPKMRIFNVDGSEPEMCGNGLRCIARYTLEKFNLSEMEIYTLKSKYKVRYSESNIQGLKCIAINIDGISTSLKNIPISFVGSNFIQEDIEFFKGENRYTAVSISNPHIVSVVKNIDSIEMKYNGEKITSEKNFFPEGINLSYLVKVDDKEVFVRTYERGVGFTKSCGTGMMSSVTNLCIMDDVLFDENIIVHNDGGSVEIKVSRSGPDQFKAVFSGNATYVESGEIFLSHIGEFEKNVIRNYDVERDAYCKLLSYKDSRVNGLNNLHTID